MCQKSQPPQSLAKDEEVGVSASNRIRGIVLHDILAKVAQADDLSRAVDHARMTGELTDEEAGAAMEHLSKALCSVEDRGWFSGDAQKMLNEVSLIDIDGQIYRPDRVVVKDGAVVIVDYKFGNHKQQYIRQVRKYMDIWRRMGYGNVSGFLWYVDALSVVEV